MDEKAKQFRSKYFYARRRTTLPQEVDEISKKKFDEKYKEFFKRGKAVIQKEKEDIEK